MSGFRQQPPQPQSQPQSPPPPPSPYSPTHGPHRPPHPRTRRSIDAISSSPHGAARMQGGRNGAMPMPVGNAPRPFSSRAAEGGGMPLRMAASPPKNKNTQHVPCKFFLQGQCQAGQMCPFSHDIESTTRPAPCKYFAKGGCKFGRKCALLHVTQDGTVVNRHFPPSQYHHAPAPPLSGAYGPAPPGLLSMQAQGLEQRPNGDAAQQEFENYQYGSQNGYDANQQIDMTYTSASPKYGSPSQNDRMGSSPLQKGLSIMDAPLPNSFDSNGISLAAMNGPFAASVPARFDLDSPPSSLPRKSQLGNTALRDLHNSAFGERGMDNMLASMGSSPPSGTDEPIKFEKRSLLSSGRLHVPSSRPMVSASLGTAFMQPFHAQSDEEEEYDDEDTDREEDLLPSSLHDLIPEGRPRRSSKSRNGEERPSSYLAAQRRTISGQGTPQESKSGSPHMSSSPSRYTGMFARQMNGFGHVGSPLRDSSFPTSHPAGFSASGELSPGISSPPRQASMSMLTQELQRTRLDAVRSASNPQAPTSQRPTASGSARASMERNTSSNSVSQRIDEEQELFDMDFEARPTSNGGANANGGTPPAHVPAASVWNGKNETAKFGPIGGGRTAK